MKSDNYVGPCVTCGRPTVWMNGAQPQHLRCAGLRLERGRIVRVLKRTTNNPKESE